MKANTTVGDVLPILRTVEANTLEDLKLQSAKIKELRGEGASEMQRKKIELLEQTTKHAEQVHKMAANMVTAICQLPPATGLELNDTELRLLGYADKKV